MKPKNSILKQSINDTYTPFQQEINERDHKINADGFGLTWEKNNQLFSYKSIKPPWNDYNIMELSNFIESNLFLVHIRAIKPFSINSVVHQFNCHPFRFKNFVFMHNGEIKNKIYLTKYLYQNTNLNILNNIRGTTDSEYAFHIFLSLLDSKYLDGNTKLSQNYFAEKIKQTIQLIINLTNDIASLNFAFYDGKTLICTRFINSKSENPPSLYYSKNLKLNDKSNFNTLISSEPINENKSDWNLIPKNKLIMLTQYNKIILKNINIE